MKIAVIGDIHSNHVALETCIRHALDRKVDEFIFLGDYISDCPYPQRTMKIIYEMDRRYRCFFIRGNREDYMLDYRNSSEKNWIPCSARGSLLYTYENLTSIDLDFYENLDIKGIYRLETGNDYTTPCLQLATKLCREAEGDVTWPYIDEKYWKMAADSFGIS